MRARLALAAACAAALLAAPGAGAHGGEIIARAIEGLRSDPVYVDPAAVPGLEQAEADELRDRIGAAGGRIYVAVLPADAQHELATADAVVEEIAAAIGGESSFAVLVGGQLRAASVERPAAVERLEAELVADAESDHGDRLVRFVEGVDEARGEGPSWRAAVAGAVVFAAAALGLLIVLRRRRTPATTPEAAA